MLSENTKLSSSVTNKCNVTKVFFYILLLILILLKVAKSEEVFCIGQTKLILPVANHTLERFIDASLLYQPQFIIQDGLPWYGTIRDDWYPHKKPRKHYGIDFYADSINVLAMADGVVTAVGNNRKAGGNMRILHADSIETMYLHLSEIFVWKGKRVKKGEQIALITKPEGNAYQTQLHFSILVRGKFVDPVKWITEEVKLRPMIKEKLERFQLIKEERELKRKILVEEYNRKWVNERK